METENVFLICIAAVVITVVIAGNMGPPNVGFEVDHVLESCHYNEISEANCKEAIDKVKGNCDAKQ